MKQTNYKKVNLTSADLSEEKLQELRLILPEAFSENKIDWDRLRAVLGDKIDSRIEKFSFSWAGKSNAIKNVLIPSKATLRPAKKESVKFDESENLFIEGDNLEVLKLLQKAYFEKVKSVPSKIVSPIIADGRIENIDKIGEIERKGEIEVKLNNLELQNKFDRFIFQSCSPYAPADSSDRMKNAIYKFFEVNFKIKKYDSKAQKIVLGKENVQPILDVINLAKEQYKAEVVEKLNEVRERVDVPAWEAPIVVNYNSHYKKELHQKSILKPFYATKLSEPERIFIDMLDNDKKVVWWFKNGESEIKYFAVSYKDENGIERAFYVDFIFRLKDGTIALFDTKSGMTAKDAGPRAEGLQKYIKAQSKMKNKLWGGIAIYENGSWRYSDSEKYKYNPNNLSDWKVLTL